MADMSSPGDSTRDPIDYAFTVAAGSGADDPTVTRAADFSAPDGDALPTVSGYEVLGVLGRGGVGVVYKARQLALNRVVAIKLISGMASAAVLIRFRQEAEAVARLQHPNIIQVFEVGSCPSGSFLALEYVDGGTLKEKVAGVPHPPRDAARAVETLARAVHHAHEHRLIHRDLKPHNVLVTAGGVLKIADFGLARSLDAGDGVTITTDFVGTPAYAAPEQVAAQLGAISPATDVYSLGVILYELLVGRVPFDTGSIPEVLRMVADTEPVSPRRLRPEIPRDLETICLKCLRKEPGKRYASATDLADDLHHFQAGEPISARPVGKLERAARWAKRNPAVAGLMGAVFALLTVVAVVATIAAVRIDQSRETADTNARAAQQAAADEASAKEAAERERDAARKAEREGKEKLLQSFVSEARASRYSRRIGQRFGTLDAVRKATELARELGKPDATFDELRNLAIAALALPDLKPDSVWVRPPSDTGLNWAGPFPDPTYRRVVFIHQQGAIRVCRAGTGPDDCGEIARIPGSGSEVGLQWSADGRFMGALPWQLLPRRLRVWRMDGEQPVLALDVPKDCWGFFFTPDAREIMVMEGEQARTYDLATGQSAREFTLPAGTKLGASHNPVRPELAIGQPTRVAILELPSGKEIGSLPVAGSHLVWHPHGELLTVAAENYVEVWDVARRRRNWRLNHTGGGLYASFNPTGDLLTTTGWAGRQRLWNPYTGREVFSTIGPGAFVHGERLSTRFPAFAADPAGPLTVVEAAREYRTLPVAVGQLGLTGLAGCRIHPNGRLLAVASSAGFGLLDLATGSERAFVRGGACQDVLFEPDGALLVKTATSITRWPVAADPADPTRLRVGPPELISVQAVGESLARSTDGAVLGVSGAPGGAYVWRRDRPYDTILLLHTDCRHLAISPDGKLVATGSWSGRGIKVWEAETGRLIRLPGLCSSGRRTDVSRGHERVPGR